MKKTVASRHDLSLTTGRAGRLLYLSRYLVVSLNVLQRMMSLIPVLVCIADFVILHVCILASTHTSYAQV
jgi:hypothetical protein